MEIENRMLREVMQWIPRVIGLGMAGFCYLFMFEGFAPELSWKDAFSHFVQGSLMLILALVSWKWEKLGGSSYIALGLFVLWKFRRGRPTFVISAIVIITGLLFIFVSILF